MARRERGAGQRVPSARAGTTDRRWQGQSPLEPGLVDELGEQRRHAVPMDISHRLLPERLLGLRFRVYHLDEQGASADRLGQGFGLMKVGKRFARALEGEIGARTYSEILRKIQATQAQLPETPLDAHRTIRRLQGFGGPAQTQLEEGRIAVRAGEALILRFSAHAQDLSAQRQRVSKLPFGRQTC
jgi:hypothetical protein